MMNTNKRFWEQQHLENNVDTLSGCNYQETIDFLKVSEYIKPGMTVLEIGVGMGYVTKMLKQNKCLVSTLDISELALSRVEDLCEATFNLDEIYLLANNYYDLIICHNVIQHIPTDLLRKELSEVLRSLKIGGIFALEFVSAIGFEDACIQESGEGCYCRTPEFMVKLIAELSSNIFATVAVNNDCDEGKITGCHVLHIWKDENR